MEACVYIEAPRINDFMPRISTVSLAKEGKIREYAMLLLNPACFSIMMICLIAENFTTGKLLSF